MMKTITKETINELIGKLIIWKAPIYEGNMGHFGNGKAGGIVVIREINESEGCLKISKFENFEGDNIGSAKLKDDFMSFSDSDRIVEYEVLGSGKIDDEPFAPFNLLNTSHNVFKAIHVNSDTAALHWYGTNPLGENIPLFGSEYFPIEDMPELLQEYFMFINKDDLTSSCYVVNDMVFTDFAKVVVNA